MPKTIKKTISLYIKDDMIRRHAIKTYSLQGSKLTPEEKYFIICKLKNDGKL